MTRSKSKAEDYQRSKQEPDQVTKKHGGQVVESISEDELISVHETDCKHVTLIRDPSETEFNAFMCANPNCAIVVLYDKK